MSKMCPQTQPIFDGDIKSVVFQNLQSIFSHHENFVFEYPTRIPEKTQFCYFYLENERGLPSGFLNFSTPYRLGCLDKNISQFYPYKRNRNLLFKAFWEFFSNFDRVNTKKHC